MCPCPDSFGDILLLAGQGGHIEGGWESFNDVWRFVKDRGTWEILTTAAEWGKRTMPTVRCGPQGELALCGGEVIYPEVAQCTFNDLDEPTLSDVWRSRDGGRSWQCACEEGPFPKTRAQWLVYLPRNSMYVLFGQREGVNRAEARVYTSVDLSRWDLLAEDALGDKIRVVATQLEIKHLLPKDDGTLIFLTSLLA
jgi:hypothetical protein